MRVRNLTIRDNVTVSGCTANEESDAMSIGGGDANNSPTEIIGGTFDGSVTNGGTISGGAFTGPVWNNGIISGGQFTGSVGEPRYHHKRYLWWRSDQRERSFFRHHLRRYF